jgi:hypothetical protein
MATACRQEGDFGTSRWARLELGYIIHASGRTMTAAGAANCSQSAHSRRDFVSLAGGPAKLGRAERWICSLGRYHEQKLPPRTT